jgi:uncharacterized protein
MLERDDYPAGVPCWIDTAQPDPEAAAEFYGGLFGWDLEDLMPAEAPGHYFVARLRGLDVAAVASPADGGDASAVWTTYIRVDDADAAAVKVRTAGGTVRTEPFDVRQAGRMAVCADPAGAEFIVWQAGTRRGAQIVNAPGTWNWSDLNTRDIEEAKAFYGSVFDWETDTVDLGFGQGTMVRAPGYAEFLERYDADLRRRHADAGAPSGVLRCDLLDDADVTRPVPRRRGPALERHLRHRRHRRHCGAGEQARRRDPGPALRRRPDPCGCGPRPPGGGVHGEPLPTRGVKVRAATARGVRGGVEVRSVPGCGASIGPRDRRRGGSAAGAAGRRCDQPAPCRDRRRPGQRRCRRADRVSPRRRIA